MSNSGKQALVGRRVIRLPQKRLRERLSGGLLFVKYLIHQLSHFEFIQLRKCERSVFQNHGVCGQAFPFLASLPLPAASISVALAPIFALPKSEKRLQRAESHTETLATQAKNWAVVSGFPFPFSLSPLPPGKPDTRAKFGRLIDPKPHSMRGNSSSQYIN